MTTMPIMEQAKKTGMKKDNLNSSKQWPPQIYNPRTEKKLTHSTVHSPS